jgi:hypothetical protein
MKRMTNIVGTHLKRVLMIGPYGDNFKSLAAVSFVRAVAYKQLTICFYGKVHGYCSRKAILQKANRHQEKTLALAAIFSHLCLKLPANARV